MGPSKAIYEQKSIQIMSDQTQSPLLGSTYFLNSFTLKIVIITDKTRPIAPDVAFISTQILAYIN